MAGAGFKTFNTGDVLTASDVNTYLMQQTVMVFASSAARTTALGANVAEGMLSYLKDTDAVEVYNGSAWVASDDPNAIQNTIVDAKGDLITATGNDVPARLAVGTNGQVLTADSTAATGLKWATTAAAGANWSLLNAGGTSLTGAATITVSGISAINEILILVAGASSASASSDIGVRLNTDTGSNYYQYGTDLLVPATYATSSFDVRNGVYTAIRVAKMASNAASNICGYVKLSGCNAAGVKTFTSSGGATPGGGADFYWNNLGGYYNSATVISSVSLFSSSGNFDAGTLYVYGSAN